MRAAGAPTGLIREVWCVNLPYMNCSDYLSRLMAERGVDFVMGYFRRNDGRWQFSLRSRNGFDCSAVAKVHGGGGHKEAAGFDSRAPGASLRVMEQRPKPRTRTAA